VQAEFGRLQQQKSAKCNTAAFPKVFTFIKVGMQISLVTMSRPSPRTVAPSPCLPLDIKTCRRRMQVFLVFLFDWWAASRMMLLLQLSYARD
jgi:hypothetical protein